MPAPFAPFVEEAVPLRQHTASPCAAAAAARVAECAEDLEAEGSEISCARPGRALTRGHADPVARVCGRIDATHGAEDQAQETTARRATPEAHVDAGNEFCFAAAGRARGPAGGCCVVSLHDDRQARATGTARRGPVKPPCRCATAMERRRQAGCPFISDVVSVAGRAGVARGCWRRARVFSFSFGEVDHFEGRCGPSGVQAAAGAPTTGLVEEPPRLFFLISDPRGPHDEVSSTAWPPLEAPRAPVGAEPAAVHIKDVEGGMESARSRAGPRRTRARRASWPCRGCGRRRRRPKTAAAARQRQSRHVRYLARSGTATAGRPRRSLWDELQRRGLRESVRLLGALRGGPGRARRAARRAPSAALDDAAMATKAVLTVDRRLGEGATHAWRRVSRMLCGPARRRQGSKARQRPVAMCGGGRGRHCPRRLPRAAASRECGPDEAMTPGRFIAPLLVRGRKRGRRGCPPPGGGAASGARA